MELQQILTAIREKTARLRELQAEVLALEVELEQIRGLVAPNGASRQRVKSRHGFSGGRRTRPIQEKSSVWWAREILGQAGGPLSADELVERIRQASGQSVQKTTLVSNLSRYVKHKDTFARRGRNTYALLDDSEQKGGEAEE
jgi:hypothetical protein